jgi:hypothetical protein
MIEMGKKIKTATQLGFSLILCGLILWHAASWRSNGKYPEMMSWTKIGQGYLTAFYNLGIILALATTLSFGLDKIASLASQFKHIKKKS